MEGNFLNGLVRKSGLVRRQRWRLTGSKQQLDFDGDQFRQEVRPITRFRSIVILLKRSSVIVSPLVLELPTQRIDTNAPLNRGTGLLVHLSRTASLNNHKLCFQMAMSVSQTTPPSPFRRDIQSLWPNVAKDNCPVDALHQSNLGHDNESRSPNPTPAHSRISGYSGSAEER